MVEFPTAYTYYCGKMLKIISSSVISSDTQSVGRIVNITKKGIEVSTGNGTILIEKVKPESKGVMNAFDFVNGAKVKIGDKLGG